DRLPRGTTGERPANVMPLCHSRDLGHTMGGVMTYLLIIGTRKGLFTARSEDRRSWEVLGPHRLDENDDAGMSPVYTVGIDPHTHRLLVGTESWHFGPSVWHSDDLGRTWTEPATAPIAFPEDTDASLV